MKITGFQIKVIVGLVLLIIFSTIVAIGFIDESYIEKELESKTDTYYFETNYIIVDSLDPKTIHPFNSQIINVTWYYKISDDYYKIPLQYWRTSESIGHYDKEIAKNLKWKDDLSRPIIEINQNKTMLYVDFELHDELYLDAVSTFKYNPRIQSFKWLDVNDDHKFNHLFKVDVSELKVQYDKYGDVMMPITTFFIPTITATEKLN